MAEGLFLALRETYINRIFRSLLLAFRGLAPKPPQLLRCLRGLGRLADPQESSKRFSKYSDRTLIFECGNGDFLFHS